MLVKAWPFYCFVGRLSHTGMNYELMTFPCFPTSHALPRGVLSSARRETDVPLDCFLQPRYVILPYSCSLRFGLPSFSSWLISLTICYLVLLGS